MLTTHDMDEAVELADPVGIIGSGRLLALDTPAALAELVPGEEMLEIKVGAGDGETSTPTGWRSP